MAAKLSITGAPPVITATSFDDLKKRINALPKPKIEDITIESTKSAKLEKSLFEGFDSITAIYISGSDIAEINDNCFEGLANLKYLYLNNNNIKRLGVECFKGCMRINELDLSGNQLTKLQSGCFTEFAMTTTCACLNLSNNEIDTIEIGAFKSLTVLYGTVSMSHNRLNKIVGNLFHNLLIEKFDLSNNKIDTIEERGLFGSNFKFLHLENNGLANIHPEAFHRCEIQSELHLEDNKLSNYAAAFKGMKNLKELYLDNNGITELPMDGFLGLNNLDTLSLNKNDCKLTKDAFTGIPNLETLHLEENGIDSIKPGTFSRLQNLRNINLSYNNFVELTPNTFWLANNEDEKTYFFTLSLHHNDIVKITPGAFAGIDRIEDLQLYGNKIKGFVPDAWKDLSFVTCIQLQNNEISDKNILHQLAPCRQVKLGGNQIEINVSSLYPNDLNLKNIEMISFNYCCYRLEDGKWKFDDRFQEPVIVS